MGLFSFLNKNKQDATGDSGQYGGGDDDAVAAQARSKRASSAGDGAARRAKAKAAADPVLPEKKRARRRLVGAIALALGVAIGLPMILDAEQKPLSSEIDFRIPSKDKPATDAAAAPAAPVAPAATLSPHETIVAPAAAVHDIAEVRTGSGKQPEVKLADKAPAKVPELKLPEPKPAAKPADKAVEKTADKTADKAADKPAAKPAEAPQDAARALAILEGKPVAPAGQKFVVQVTALASQAKVNEVQEKLTEAGIKSYTQKVPTKTGELIRVRVGPLSKDEAEKVRARLIAIGMAGSMVPL